jgi:putative ABC transport system permease protein
VIVLRRSASSELVSSVDRRTAEILETAPEVAPAADGRPLLSRELDIVINLNKKGSQSLGNVTVRGVSANSIELRPGVRMTDGKMLTFGSHEIIVGKNIAQRFEGVAIGTQVPFGGDQWTVVGIFDAGGTGFDSEIWCDVEQALQAFGRPVYSSITFRMRDPAAFEALKTRLSTDPRTQSIEPKRERDFYREQSQALSKFIRILGLVVTIIFSVGAMIGAMITMYAAVANRVVEVGTLRALGFRRRSVLAAFLVEAMLLALVGGATGLGLASLLSFAKVSTVNFSSFSELGFGFALSVSVIISAFIFALAMGVLGGFLPAVRAARLNIVNALRGV